MGCGLSKKQHEEIQNVYGVMPIKKVDTMMSKTYQMHQFNEMIKNQSSPVHQWVPAPTHPAHVHPDHMSRQDHLSRQDHMSRQEVLFKQLKMMISEHENRKARERPAYVTSNSAPIRMNGAQESNDSPEFYC